MKRACLSNSKLYCSLFSLLLAYSLLLSTITPFIIVSAKAATSNASKATAPPKATRYQKKVGQREGQVLLRFRENVSLQDKQALLSSLRAKGIRRLRGASLAYLINLPEGQIPEVITSQLLMNPIVQAAEPNYLISHDQIAPKILLAAKRSILPNEAGELVESNTTVALNPLQVSVAGMAVIAVIDGSIDFTHPDLHGLQWKNSKESVNGRDDDRNGFVDDVNGFNWIVNKSDEQQDMTHGTQVAGIIVSQKNNTATAAVSSPQLSLMSLRVLDQNGVGDVASAIEAIDYAASMGAQVINCSWGTDESSTLLRDAIERAGKRGVLVVTSAGNDGRDIDANPYYPASYGLSNLLVVASTSGADTLASWSDMGVKNVHVAAPGDNISSTGRDGSYETITGTSASAALASRVAGLIKAERPYLSAELTREMILAGAKLVLSLHGKISSGGVIDAAGAIAQVKALPPNEGRDNRDINPVNNPGGNNNPGNAGAIGVGNIVNPSPPEDNVKRTKGAPGLNLPNLDLLRNLKPDNPKAPPAIPSTRCPRQHPDCDKREASKAGASIKQIAAPEAESYVASAGTLSTQIAPSNFIAWNPSSEISPNPFGQRENNITDAFPLLGLILSSRSRAFPRLMSAPLPPSDNYSQERVDPFNRTGESGEDLISRNYNWSLPIVSLKGRAGLDLGLSLTYNSLVWTKSGSTIAFDADHGFPSPGFRLGFPVIQSKYVNEQGVYSYLMITSSGSRVELRQTGTYIYESADSSYMQLTESAPYLYVLTKDGTRLWYQLYGTDYQCTQIRDRNGNYISATYNNLGHITSVTDTLGRLITFNYDAYQNLSTITQGWRRDSAAGTVVETHTWASFGWSNLTIQTSFSGLTLSGVQNGQIIPVLTQVGLADGSRYNFEYTSWGQVTTIRNYAANNVLLNYVTYNLDTTAGQTDCPRFTQRRDYARDWNSDNEAVTSFSAFNPATGVADVTMPDTTFYREYFYTSGWSQGLTYLSENWLGGARKKWVSTYWTQDNPYLSYQLNPRPYEVRIYDEAGNMRRTTIDYTSYGLPANVREYAADGGTVLRRREIQYRFDNEFISHHVLGVIWMELTYEGESTLVSKINYHHDWDYWNPAFYSNGQTPSTGFDSANYSAPFFGRANITGVYRYNVNAPDDANQAVLIKRIGYNLAGEPFFTMDASNHRVQISYADSYSDGNNGRNTLAYPTTVTDADNYSSTIQYNYDMGVPVRTQDPKGAVQTLAYEGTGRTEKAINQTNNSYTRWVYINTTLVQQFTTIQSGEGEAYSFTIYDGAGRVRATGGDLPNSAGGYHAQYHISDIMGRVVQQSNPTEITGGWIPTGDDNLGWVWSYQSYDWKGRPTITTNPDNTTSEVSYTGCGCAGGEVVTLTSENLAQGNRRQKIYHDILGRVVKTEALNWNGSIYSTVVNTYNARDQITNIRQYAGAAVDGVPYQDTVMTYDGFGRLATSKKPEQSAPASYSYNADDTVSVMTDARGATTTYQYNNRRLVTGITYGGGYTAPAVTIGYDAAGNRTSMTDGLGSIGYVYDTLSRMTSETRYFSTLDQSFTLSYGYNLAGELTSLTDQSFGTTVNYTYDRQGRLTGVGGTGYGSIPYFTSGIQYRAWGAVKGMNYGNGRALTVSYNSRGLPVTYNIPGVMSKTYQYYNDGMLSYSHDVLDSRFDRKNSYDHLGRISLALTGTEANGGSAMDGPYHQEYQYDAFSNMTDRMSWHWTADYYDSATYANNKRTGWNYDAQGHMLNDGTTYNPLQYSYDAAGRMVKITDPAYTIPKRTDEYDGDGERLKSGYRSGGCSPGYECPLYYTYYLRSTVLGGQIVSEFQSNTQKRMGYIYHPSGSLIALQKMATSPNTTTVVIWEHWDASGMSERMTDAGGNTNYFPGNEYNAELDPVGADTGLENPYPLEQTGDSLPDEYSPQPLVNGDPSNLSNGCRIDGMPISCSDLSNRIDLGFVAMEYLLPNAPIDSNKPPSLTHPGENRSGDGTHLGWRTETREIHGLGLGLFWTEYPFVKTDSEGAGLGFGLAFGSFSHRQQQTKLTRPEVSSLIDDIYKLFKDHPECETWTNKLLAQLKKDTGFDAGSIRDILEKFRKEGNIVPGGTKGTGGGVGSGVFGVTGEYGPNVNFTYGETTELTAQVLLHELLHVAGGTFVNGNYLTKYSDKAIAEAGNKLGIIMSAEEYRKRFPDEVKRRLGAGWGHDYVESSLAGAVQRITCLNERNGVRTLP